MPGAVSPHGHPEPDPTVPIVSVPIVTANGSQRIMLYWERFAPVNACHVLELGPNCLTTWDQFREIAPQVLRSLGIGEVTADAWASRYEIRPVGECDVSSVWVTGNFDRGIEEAIDQEFLRPFATTSCPVRFLWIEESGPGATPPSQTPPRRVIAVVYRHAIADGASIRVICQHLIATCCGRTVDRSLSPYVGHLLRDLRHGLQPPGLWGTLRYAVNELMGLARCVFPKIKTLSALDRSITRLHAERVPVTQIRATADACGVTVQDLLFAATLESMIQEDSHEPRSLFRSKLALQCPVDLRPFLGAGSGEQFGQLLGSYQVRHTVRASSTFQEILTQTHRQTILQKQQNRAAYYPLSMGLISFLSRHFPGQSGFKTTKSMFPLVGGISNLNLADQFRDEFESGTVVRYARATHLGHILPMMLFVTSFGEDVTFLSTRRESFLDDEAMRRIVAHLARRASGDGDSPADDFSGRASHV